MLRGPQRFNFTVPRAIAVAVAITSGSVGVAQVSRGGVRSGLTLIVVGVLVLVSLVTGGVGTYAKWRSRHPLDGAERARRQYVLMGAGFWIAAGVAGILFAFGWYEQGFSWFSLLPAAGGVAGVGLGCGALYFGLIRRRPHDGDPAPPE